MSSGKAMEPTKKPMPFRSPSPGLTSNAPRTEAKTRDDVTRETRRGEARPCGPDRRKGGRTPPKKHRRDEPRRRRDEKRRPVGEPPKTPEDAPPKKKRKYKKRRGCSAVVFCVAGGGGGRRRSKNVSAGRRFSLFTFSRGGVVETASFGGRVERAESVLGVWGGGG